MKSKKLITRGLQIFGLLILSFFLLTIDVKSVSEVISLLDLLTIVQLIIIMFAIITFRAVRWRYIVNSLTGTRISLYFSWMSIICGVAAGSLVPGRLEGAKPMMLKNYHGIDLRVSTSGMLVERIADIQSLTLLFSISTLILFALGTSLHGNILVILLFFPVILLILYFYPARVKVFSLRVLCALPLGARFKVFLRSFIEEVFRSIEVINNRRTLWVVIFFSLSSMILEVLRFFLILRALNIDLTFIEVSFIFSLSILIGIASLVPGAIGIYEFSSAELIHTLAETNDMDLVKSAVLLDRTIAYYLLVLLGGSFISLHRYLFSDESNSRSDGT